MHTCPFCKFPEVPEGATTCPKCSSLQETPFPTIQSHIEVVTNQGGSVTGVLINHMGYSFEEVQALLSQVHKDFVLHPFSGECPYRGLEPFEEEDAGIFFGRERLVEEIIQRLKSSQFVLVAGPSGSGKSSIIRAGVIPNLKQSHQHESENWLYATLVPGRAPLDSLGNAVSRLSGTTIPLEEFNAQGRSNPNLLLQWCEVLLGERRKRRLVLFIDQFEEVFTNLSEKEEEQRIAFIRQIIQTVNAPDGRVIVLLTIRSDFLGHCAAYPELNALVNDGFLQVGAMSPEELISAIDRPAMQVGLTIEPALAYRIVLDMRDQPGALPLMQFAIKDLFETQILQEKGVSLTLGGYLARGGLGMALRRYADTTFAQLTPSEQDLARALFRGLVVPGRGAQDTRRTALFHELIPSGVNLQQMEVVVNKLANARLITTGEQTRNGQGEAIRDERTITLAHERLLEVWPWLRRLVDENRTLIELKNELEEAALRWDENQRDFSYLYHGAQLDTTLTRLEHEALSPSDLALTFVQAGVEHRKELLRHEQEREKNERRKNRLRLWAVAVGVILLILAGSLWLRSLANQWGPSIFFAEATATIGENNSKVSDVSQSLQLHLPAFKLDVHEVTNDQYCLCRLAFACNSDPAYENYRVCDTIGTSLLLGRPAFGLEPVSNITLDQADQYCKWLGGRLPTEIEWEWAARGAENRTYPSGNDRPVPGQVNIWDGKSNTGAKWPVDRASQDITAEKLLNMDGNVREWTLTVWLNYDHPKYLNSDWPDQILDSNGYTVIRGGSFRSGSDSARSISRVRNKPNDLLSDLGFRCVQGVSIQEFKKEVRLIP